MTTVQAQFSFCQAATPGFCQAKDKKGSIRPTIEILTGELPSLAKQSV